MNTLSSRAPQHSPAVPSVPSPAPSFTFDHAAYRAVGPLDRLSLRLGLWLLTRHAARVDAVERRAAAAHRARLRDVERECREHEWYRAAALQRPPG